MNQNLLLSLPGVDTQEVMFIEEATKELTEDQQKNFFLIYQGKRKDPQTIMICTILGFLVVAGVQRFLLGQVGMGILYLFTGGLCLVGTIVDLVNYRKLTWEYNQKMVVEASMMSKSLR